MARVWATFHPFPRLCFFMSRSPKSTAAAPADFEAGVVELETLLAQLENGQLPLEQALAAYQRGQTLLRYCEGKLEDAEQQLKVLEGGELKPYSAEAP